MFKHKPIVTAIAMAMSNLAHADLNSGLVAYYPFNGNANDASGNINNGIVYGATLTADRFGNVNSAYSFDGVNDYIEIEASNSLDTRYSISIFSWVNSQGNSGPIVNYCTNCWGVHLWETKNSNPSELFAHIVKRDYSYTNYLQVDNVLISEWKFIGTTYDYSTGTAKLWSNGVQILTIDIGQVEIATQDSIRIGLRDYDSRIFTGIIDDIRIYNRALSQSEITELYTLKNPNTPLAPTSTSKPATNITINSATLNGNVISNGTTATANFEFGPTVIYGTTVAAAPAKVYSSTPVAISANKTGLACNTTYHYRTKAVNSVGTGYGTDQSFTTLATCGAPNTWLYPATPAVLVGKAFSLDIHVNSNNNNVGAYDYTVNFDTTKLLVDTSYQNAAATCEQGICPGTSALSASSVNVDTSSGNIKLTGFDPTGTGSGNDLQLLHIHFIAKSTPGTTVVGLTTNELTNAVGEPLGSVATGATVNIGAGLCGDSDGTGVVNIVDALAIARYLVGLPPPPTINPNLADVNRSGTVSIVDALYISRYAVGLVVTGTCSIGQPL